jgi:GTP-binding protein Era
MDIDGEDVEDRRAGFVAVVGRPNAGKSSLLNHLVDYKLVMVSKKAQATRKRVNVIVTHKNSQIVFVDTPGIHKRERLLNRFMMEEVIKAIGDSDLAIFIAPITDRPKEYEKFLKLVESKGIEHILVLSKIDTISSDKILEKISQYQKYQDRFVALIPYSVKRGIGKKELLDLVSKHLPPHPWLYEPELLSTENVRDIYKEFIREAIFDKLSDEIPYESDVIIDEIVESENIDRVYATIITEKESQKGVIVGGRGESIKRVNIKARRLMEKFSQKKVFLETRVVVRKGWSRDKRVLETIGYIF